jgi:hypothetical protein
LRRLRRAAGLPGLATLALVTAGQRDPVITLYRTLLAYGLVGLLILTAGLIEFLHFEPFGVTAGMHVRIVGVYRYDQATHQTSGGDQSSFARNEQFAAVVDWSGLPDDITVQALWYDSFENVVGLVGPARPSALAGRTIIPAAVPQGLKYHLPGEYIFAVERLDGGRPVEVLARRLVVVERS